MDDREMVEMIAESGEEIYKLKEQRAKWCNYLRRIVDLLAHRDDCQNVRQEITDFLKTIDVNDL